MIKAIIFDLDGVIVDTAVFHYEAWRNLAHELGFDFTLEQNERLKGVSRLESLDILFELGKIKGRSDEERNHLASKKNVCYRDKILKMTPKDILPGVNDFLLELKESEYKIAIGSSSKNARTILEKVELKDFFDSVVDGLKISNSKPDPEVFLTAAKELNVKPEHCLVFEDATAGIIAAKRGGMIAIGVGQPENLPNADQVIPDFSNMSVKTIDDLTK